MSARHTLLPIALCCSTQILAAAAPAPPMDAATDPAAGVRSLMDDYHAAVASHDGERLARLFVPTGSAWFNVLSGSAYAAASAKSPGAQKVRPSTVADFVRFVSTLKAPLDPQHGPVRIQTDGAIASAYFEFRFFIDGKLQNTGSESWQLVRYPDGWRIASIVFSSTPPAASAPTTTSMK